ncbi:hypothetical protein FOZ62_025938, partial [Perkinsus olseni]
MPRSEPTELSLPLINPARQPKRRLRNVVIGFVVILVIFAALYGLKCLVARKPEEIPAESQPNTLLPVAAVSGLVGDLCTYGRRHNIEYNGYFTDHSPYLSISLARSGAGSNATIDDFMKYEERLDPAVPPDVPINNVSDVERYVNSKREHYGSFLKYFDSEVRDAASLDDVVRAHFPRVRRGLGGAAFHPLILTGVALEAENGLLLAEGLAYLHVRTMRDYDSEEASMVTPGTSGSPGEVLFNFTEAVSEMLPLPSGTARADFLTKPELSGVLLKQRVDWPEDFEGLQRVISEQLVPLAAAALYYSDNEFFVLHGWTSLYALARLVPHLGAANVDTARSAVDSWFRAYMAAFAQRGLPGARDLKAWVQGNGEADQLEVDWTAWTQQGQEIVNKDPGQVHVIKSIWMLHMRWAEANPEDTKARQMMARAAKNIAERPIRFAKVVIELSDSLNVIGVKVSSLTKRYALIHALWKIIDFKIIVPLAVAGLSWPGISISVLHNRMGAGSPATSDTISTSPAVDRVLQVEVLQSYIMQFLSVPSLAAFGLTSTKIYKIFDSELAWTDTRLRACRVIPSITRIAGVSPKEVFHASLEASEGVVAYEERDFEAAIEFYDRALSIFRDVNFITRLADVKYATRDRQRAKALYEEAHAADPKNSYAVNGLALFARTQSEEERLLRLAVELDPMNSYALANLGGIVMCEAWDDLSQMRNKEAEELLQRAVNLNSKLFYAPRMLETVRAIQ